MQNASISHPATVPTGARPAASIVIPCYIGTARQAELLAETLATVDAQTCRDFEVVLVDDGSPLDFSELTKRYSFARTLRQDNAGSAIARNTGIAASRGENFVFLDADDHLLPRALEAGLLHLDQHPECGFVIGRREEMTYEGEPVRWGVAAMPRETQLYRTLLGFDWYIIPPSSAMFRREVVERVGGFRDPWGADDLDFYLRAARQYAGRCFEEPAVTRYRRYSASSSRDGERMLRSVREVYAREWQFVKGDAALEAAFYRGLVALEAIFADCLAENFADRWRAGKWRAAVRAAAMLARENPRRFLQALRPTPAPRQAISPRPVTN